MPPELLILEPDARGHAFEWLQHIVEYSATDRHPARLALAVPAPLAEKLSAWMKTRNLHNAELHPLSPRESELCMHRRLAVSGLARWWTMRRHLAESGAPQGLFLGMDHLSLPLALGLGFGGRKVSGILFRPSVHYQADNPGRLSLRERLRDLRKDLLYRLMFRNRAVKAVFSLDPYFPSYSIRRYVSGDKTKPLSDPAHPRDEGSAAASSPSPFPAGRTSFLLFGVLTERKGVLVLLEALRALDENASRRTAILIAGEIAPEIRTAVKELQDEVQRNNPELWLEVEDRHLSTEEISAFTRHCDVVLAPYQRFVGSSGILLWAAGAGKPVLTQGYGLLGKLAHDYRLGTTCETTSPSELAFAIEAAVSAGPETLCDPCGIARFLTGRTPRTFSSQLFNGMFHGPAPVPKPERVTQGDASAMNWSRSRAP
ncbi:MAG: hypothetical protein AMXMBFR74_12100 [Parvibaculum sp.]|uniref:glycosyltransferase n=1 Tax=Parvibaculum sp. TaxID=2024848 RepID=UPI0035BA36B9